MKKILILLVVLLALVLLVILSLKVGKSSHQEPIYVSHEMVVQQIEEMGKLEVVKYNIQDIMEYEKARRWLPNSKTSIKIVGEVIACIDLSKIEPDDIKTSGDSVSILLPMPEICNYKIDHSKSKVYNVEYGLWETAALIDDAYRQAEDHLYRQALKMGIADESHRNSIKVLTPILKSLGFKRIEIGFKNPNANTSLDGKSPQIKNK